MVLEKRKGLQREHLKSSGFLLKQRVHVVINWNKHGRLPLEHCAPLHETTKDCFIYLIHCCACLGVNKSLVPPNCTNWCNGPVRS